MNESLKSLLRIKSPKKVDMIFDLICTHNYFCGSLNKSITVDDNREVFEHIKKLLKK